MENDNATNPGPSTTATFEGDTSFSPDQLSQMAQSEVESGRLTREQANDMLKSDGVDPITRPTAPKNENEAEIDTWSPPASPEEFLMPRLVGEGEEYTAATAALDKQVRGWLAGAKFTKGIGSAVAEEAFKTADKWLEMNEGQREVFAREQQVGLHRLWKEKTQENLAMAKQLVKEVDAANPGLIDFLEDTGAGNSLNVILQFAHQAEILRARNGGR